MDKKTLNCDVAILGGGISALVCGSLLSQKGYKIFIFEKNSFLGGRSSYINKEGFILDYGLHLNRFAGNGVCAKVLKELKHKPNFINPTSPLLYHQGEFYNLFLSLAGLSFKNFLSLKSRLSIVQLLFNILTEDENKLLNTSVHYYANQHKVSSEIYLLLQILSTAGLIREDLTEISMGEFIYFIKKSLTSIHGAAYPKDGWKEYFNLFEQKIKQHGQIFLKTKVENITIENKKAVGLETNDFNVNAKIIIYAAPSQNLFSVIEEKYFPKKFTSYCKNIEPTAGISIDFALNKKISDIKSIVFTTYPFTMGIFISNIEPHLAPADKQLLTWYYPLKPVVLKNEIKVKQEEIYLLKLLNKMFPALKENILFTRKMILPIVDGAVPKIGQTFKDRPKIKCKYVENLFLCGDTVNAKGEGGDIAWNSGMICAKKVIEVLRS